MNQRHWNVSNARKYFVIRVVVCYTAKVRFKVLSQLQLGSFKIHKLNALVPEERNLKAIKSCPTHGECLILYCNSCKDLCCSACCLHGSHKSHDYKIVNEATEETRKRIERKVTILKDKKQALSGCKSQLDVVVGKIQEESDLADDLIREKMIEVLVLLNEKKKQLFAEKQQRAHTQLAHAERHATSCVDMVERIDQVVGDFDAVSKITNHSEYIQAAAQLEAKLDLEMKNDVSTVVKDYSSISKLVKLNTDKIADEIQALKVFEKISVVFGMLQHYHAHF